MTAADDLLRRIEADPAIAAALAWPGDFDIERRDPVEDVVLPTGAPLQPIAGCGAGGTYFLCGEPGSEPRPVLYADSEGQATLIGADLAEALTLIAVLPFWRDLAQGFPVDELLADLRAEEPDFDAERDALLTALALPPLPPQEAATRLLTTATRTTPDYLPFVPDDDHLPYQPIFPSTPEADAAH
ncbi:hypothetical protein [Actinacidiphila bryophytorum]|uniref:hypothetical protein n=1 Tax=Actinacidiphila bryophytorum TaxID=1436133 RepID=UPI002176E792|nr:hypothetical protein [Actinacidiphila bryophytorum]UWE12466.1 hypothetical protein NYE86_29790 [Actinacidiphila bryophytorum]